VKTVYAILTLSLFTSLLNKASAQPDTIIVYHIYTQNIDTILPVTFNTNTASDNTSSSVGTLGNQVPLSLTPPVTNLFANTSFSDIAPVDLFFNATDYPARTAARLFYYNNGIPAGCCSGIMVSKDFVLTAGHCVYNTFGQSWDYDSLLVAPGYHNGIVQPSMPVSVVEKVYIFKTFYDNSGWDDIALLQLKQPIGLQTGWIGMAFNNDTSYFTGRVFHKLSYPGVVSPFDSTKVYNGDTLYYNYGYINNLLPDNLGVTGPQVQGIPGQSGSSLFFTDNVDYYSFGVLSFSTHYRHYKIDQQVFYQLENIVSNYATDIPVLSPGESNVNVYPNPFASYTTIQLGTAVSRARVSLFNAYGEEVKRMENISGKEIMLMREDLAEGLYFVRISENERVIATCNLVIAN
jgi:V8-like Glu-specific endopeptidase